MEQECACCPVCTLYLREGISLQSHLETHPKDKVIEALLRARNVSSTQFNPQPTQEHLHGQSCVAQNSGTVFQTKTHGSSQTQVTATVSYQHFVTTNASTVMPQYIQVVAPNSSPPLVPNHAFALMPQLQPAPYVQTMYNPLYNPYIPQPYPMVHPIYTNMPFSSDVNPLMSTSQITSPVVAPSPSQLTSPVVAPSNTQFTSPVVAPSNTQFTSPVVAPSPTQFTSQVVAPSPTQFTSQVVAPSPTQFTSQVVAPSPTQFTSPVVAPSPTQFTSQVVAPSPTQFTSQVVAPSPTQFTSQVVAPSPTQFTSPVVASSTTQVTNTVMPPSISPAPSTVIAPSTSPVPSTVITPSTSPVPSAVIAPTTCPATSTVIPPSTSPILSTVIAPSISPIPSRVIAPTTCPAPSTVIAPSTSPILSTVIAPSISPIPSRVIAPTTCPAPSTVIAPSTSPILSTVIAPSISPIPSRVIAPSISPIPSTVIAPSTSPLPSTVIPPSISPVPSRVIAPSTSPVPSTVIPPSTSPVPSTVIPPSTSPVPSTVITPSTSPVPSTVITPSTSPVPSTVIAPSTSPLPSTVIAPSTSPVPSTVIAPATSQVTNTVMPPSISPVPSTVIAPSTSPVPSTVIAPSTSQDVSGGMLGSVLKEVSSADRELIGRRKSKKLQLSLKLNSKMKSRLHSRLNSRSQRVFKTKKQMGLRKELTASTLTESLSEILTSRTTTTDENGATNAVANTSVIAKVKNSEFENEHMSPPKMSNSSTQSVITQIPMELMFRSRSPSEASHSSTSSPGQTPPPSVPLPSSDIIESADVHLDPEDSIIKSEFEQSSEYTANTSEYSVSCERAASSCSVITDRNSAVVFTGDTYVSNCSMYEDISDCESQNESSFPQLPFDEEANIPACDRQPEMSGNVSENFKRNLFGNNQDRSSEYNGEIPKNMYQPYGMEQEEKVSFNFDFGNRKADPKDSNTNREKISYECDEFVPEESLPSGTRDEEPEDSDSELTDNTTRGSAEVENTTPGVKKLSSVIFLRNSSRSNLLAPMSERTPQVEEEVGFRDRKSITYTDLQPATDNSVLGGFGMASCLNLNNYMEVDGVKIFFSAGNEQHRPLEPIVKFTTPKMDEPKDQDCMKPEKEREALTESVIQLVSGTTPKGNFYGETFSTSTSENNSEVRDLSPLSLNIRADESMPARGELSEQESLGAENTTWNLFRAEVITKSERDLMSGNEFHSTILDFEDGDGESKSAKGSLWREGVRNLKKENSNDSAEEDEKSKKGTPRKSKVFYCPQCPEKFRSLRSKRKHLLEIHFYDLKKDFELTPANGTKQKREIFQKNDVTETKSDSDNVSVIAEQFIKDSILSKMKSVASKPVERSPEYEIIRMCPDCHLPCMGLRKLKEHMKEVHGTSKFRCEDCCEMFEGEKEYSYHLQVHPLKCKQCGKSFTRKQSLKLHTKRHMTVKPFGCGQCSKTFVTRQKLDEHLNGHAGIKPLKCLICDRTFSRHSNLIQHRNLHHNRPAKKAKDFICRCGEVFHSSSKLAWHKEVHDAKPKSCPFCTQKFVHKNSVTRHIRRTHLPHYLPYDKKDTDNIQCPICGKMYLRSSLLVHMRIHSGERPFACKVCTKRFTTKWNMEIHSWTHQSRNSLPFRCLTCKSAFYREADYIAHMNAHRNSKPFTCNICGQKFVRKYNCLRHQEEHKSEKKFFCTVTGCEKSFHRSYYLKEHLRVHTGARPHTCHICGKGSTTKSNHNKHVRIHDTREPLNTEN